MIAHITDMSRHSRKILLLLIVLSSLSASPAIVSAQYIKMSSNFTCNSYSINVDFFGAEDGEWRLARVYKDEILIDTQEFDGKTDVPSYFTASGPLPASAAYHAKLARLISGNRTNTVNQEFFRFDRKNTCPTEILPSPGPRAAILTPEPVTQPSLTPVKDRAEAIETAPSLPLEGTPKKPSESISSLVTIIEVLGTLWLFSQKRKPL